MAVRQTYSYNDPATINYRLKGYGSNKLLLENLRTGVDAKLDIVAKDRDGTDDSKLRLFSLGDIEAADNQRLVLGWDKTKGAYQIKSQLDGAGVYKQIMLGMGPSNPSITIEIDNSFTVNNFLNLGAKETKTINAGVIAITKSIVEVDTQGGAPADDLVTINGGKENDVLWMHSANNARAVTVKDGTGNIWCNGDRLLDNTKDTIMFIYYGGTWNSTGFKNNL